jgi:hypothetical protein
MVWVFALWSMRLALAKGDDATSPQQRAELQDDVAFIEAIMKDADGGLGIGKNRQENEKLASRGRACFDRERRQGRLPGPGYAYCLTNLPARAQDTAVR